MPKFHWSGRTTKGQEVSGTKEAAYKEEVVRALQAQKITVISIAEKNQRHMTPMPDPDPSAMRPSPMGRIVFIVLAILAICMIVGLIRKFIG
jgi:type II secretory pathway component PulF